MTQVTIKITGSSANDAGIQSGDSSSYALARAGTGSLLAASDNLSALTAGQSSGISNFNCFEQFYIFDLSSIPAGVTITTATLKLWSIGLSNPDNHFTAEVHMSNWSPPISTGHFVAGADLSTANIIATCDTSTSWVGIPKTLNTFTPNSKFAPYVQSKLSTGQLALMVASSDHRLGNQPGPSEINTIKSTEAGKTPDTAELHVTYAVSMLMGYNF